MGMKRRSWMASLAAQLEKSARICLEHVFRVAHEVHLVDRHHDVGDAQQRRDERVAAGLLQHALAGVHEHDGEVRGGRARDHVAGVLDVARACPRR